MDKQAFKQRMQNLKSYQENNPGKGYWDWRNSLPDNLKYTDDTEYNMRGAYESGAQPILENDGFYHLPTRNPQTGEILKTSLHPTLFSFWNDEYLGLNCNSTFDLRKDPIYSKDLTIEELQSLVKDDYFSYEELKTYFDRILEEYYLNTNE